MYRSLLIATALLATGAAADLKYPATKTVDAKETYFGQTYADPYRWLEDLKSKDVETWFKAQADLTEGQLAKIPAREALANEWMELDKLKPATYRAFSVEHGKVFYKKTLGGENVGKLFIRDSWTGKEKLLFDPSTYKAANATATATVTINSFSPSFDARYVALQLTSGGAEYGEIRVLEVATGKLLPETIYPTLFGVASWNKDSKSFFWDAGKVTDIKDPTIELHRKTRLHVVGTDPAKDVDFFSDETHPELKIAEREFPVAYIDETWPDHLVGMLATVQNEMKLFTAPVSEVGKKKIAWTPLCDHDDKLVRGLAFDKDYAYAVTHADAPHYKLVRTKVAKPDWAHAEVVLPEAQDSIQYINRSKGYLLAVYSNGIVGRVVRVDLKTGKSNEVKLPATGSVDLACPDAHSDKCLIWISSWISPTTLFDYDAAKDSAQKSVFNTEVTYPGFDNLETEEVEVKSHDGTMVPLSLIHTKGLKLDGSHSAILEGYGAYSISYSPGFNVRHSLALHDVVLGYCHVRGGGEKGEAWYKAGYKTTKPNTWKDFIACGEYLVSKGYTSPGKLAGTGTSAGGILISRAITERPDLFGAAVCNVGCANAARMEFSPNGPVNVPEFGSVTVEAEVKALFEMDGVSHVKKGVKYPAVLGVAGWNDPRVVPWQPGKFVAAVQNNSTSGKPALMLVNYDNGHFTEEKLVTFRNFATQYAFALWQTGHKEFQPKDAAAPATK